MEKTKSVTKRFLEEREDGNSVESLETDVWYSGFERVRKYAEDNGLPLVGVWSNGDACGFCTRLEKNFMTDTFREWMKDSGCVFWFGHSADKEKEDRVDGKNWARGEDRSLQYYPFMRFFWTDGRTVVDRAASGNDWNYSKAGEKGADAVIVLLEKLLDGVHSNNVASCAAPEGQLRVRVNPEWSEEEVADFRKALADNDGYCPCVPEHTPDSKCMCRWFREQEIPGNCHCGLYDKYYA